MPGPMIATGYHRTPHLAGDTLVFVSEDDLWTVPVRGGVAQRLTLSVGECSLPRLSPDGSTVAFVGRDEGHPEVFIIPAAGGPAQRITYLGAEALYVCGWSADGADIFFTSDAGSPFVRGTNAFAVPGAGGAVRALGVGHAMSFAVAANGAMLIGRNAIDPARWKRYRGGTAGQLWVDARGDGMFARLGRAIAGNLVWPMWLGERVFFLSDHEGIGNIYSSRADGSDLCRHSDEHEYYARFPATDGTRIVYACGAEIVLLDPRDGSCGRIEIATPSSAPQTARRFVDAGDLLETFGPSPDGTSLGLISRGRAFAMPLWEEAVTEYGGDDARRRHLTWLHDGNRVAYVDDSAGFERIAIEPADRTEPALYVSDTNVGRITELIASPVDDTLAFANHRHELLVLAPGSPPRVLDSSQGWRVTDVAFSPDGRYVAYAWSPAQDTSIIRIADLRDGTVHDATTPLRTDRAPAWDPQGKYLYFISTRDFHPVYDALQFDLSFPQAMRPFVVTLRTDVANPFVAKPAPLHRAKDDDDADDDADKNEKLEITIDFDGLPQRMLGFPVEEGHYEQIAGGKGRAIYSQFPVRGIAPHARAGDEPEGGGTLAAYDFAEQREATLATDVDDFRLGGDGRTLVYASREKLRVIDVGGDLPEEEDEPKAPAELNRRSGYLDLGRISLVVEPRSEWRQMYAEAWRLQREQFWDEGMSGVDWDAVYVRYAALLPRLRTRIELSDLIWEMQGELGTSHAYEIGGDFREPPQYRRGFLGADYVWDDAAGGYRITRIYRGDSWDRNSDSPLAEPGLDVRTGDVLLALGGRRFTRDLGPDALLVNLAEREITLTIGRDGERRRVLARTLRDERMLRYRAWVEENRRTVHERSAGDVGYIHIPDMGPWGFAEFHRGFLSEFNRRGLIVDVRYNRGGHISPLLLEKLARKRVGYDVSRYGPAVPYPPESLAGPIVAITNQFAGSDGDIFSHCFKLYGLGPLVGMRTWGGVIGINPYHRLVDGTLTTQPEYSFWFSDVGWGVENYGTDPDVEVDIAPHESMRGADPQMERALELMAESLRDRPERAPFGPRPDLTLPAAARELP